MIWVEFLLRFEINLWGCFGKFKIGVWDILVGILLGKIFWWVKIIVFIIVINKYIEVSLKGSKKFVKKCLLINIIEFFLVVFLIIGID